MLKALRAPLAQLLRSRTQALNTLLPAAGAALAAMSRAWQPAASPPPRLGFWPSDVLQPLAAGASADAAPLGWLGGRWGQLNASQPAGDRAEPPPWAVDILLMAVPKRRTSYSAKRIRQNAHVRAPSPGSHARRSGARRGFRLASRHDLQAATGSVRPTTPAPAPFLFRSRLVARSSSNTSLSARCASATACPTASATARTARRTSSTAGCEVGGAGVDGF